jgi:argininosuccinate lyase
MLQAAAEGFINATECADYLVKKGLPFREAYQITGELVAYCLDNNLMLSTLPLQEYISKTTLFAEDIYEAINLENCVKGRNTPGGPAPDAVMVQINDMKDFVNSLL